MSEKDNTKLKPAEKNPWYVLATICDKQDEKDKGIIVDGSAIINREVWNSWAISKLNDKQKKFIREKNPDILDDSPSWDSIKKDVQKRLQQRGVENIPSLELEIDISNLRFANDVSFRNFIFPAKVFFSKSQFNKFANFDNAFFFEHADFSDIIFSDQAIFESSIFVNIDFRGTVFNEGTFFSDASFVEVSFIETHFKGSNLFVRTGFQGYSLFDRCQFQKPCNFRKAKFEKAYPTLDGAMLNEKSTISAKKENWPDPKNCEQDPEIAKASCATLRHIMNLQGLPEQAHFFFRREMHFASKIGSIWQRFPYLLFGWFSDYGNSIKLPSIWLLGLWFFPAMVYWPYLCSGVYTDIFSLEFWNSVARTSALSFGLSLGNLFQFTGLQRVYLIDIIKGLPWGLKFLGGAQTLLAIPLLFLLLLGLRNRFRLK